MVDSIARASGEGTFLRPVPELALEREEEASVSTSGAVPSFDESLERALGLAEEGASGETASKDASKDAASEGGSYREIFEAAASRYGVPLSLLLAVGKAESNFNPNDVSSSGAMGIMQLMPGTARELGVRDAFDPTENIMGGASYLAQKIAEYGGDVSLALAAYNAGSANVEKYGGIPPFSETQNYVRKVLGYMEDYEREGVAAGGTQAAGSGANAAQGQQTGATQAAGSGTNAAQGLGSGTDGDASAQGSSAAWNAMGGQVGRVGAGISSSASAAPVMASSGSALLGTGASGASASSTSAAAISAAARESAARARRQMAIEELEAAYAAKNGSEILDAYRMATERATYWKTAR